MIYQGDSADKLREMEANSVDSLVTDPPAGISFMGEMTEFGRAWKDWDGYFYVSRKINGKWTSKPLHVLRYEAAHGKVPAGYDVHHIDHDHTNNSVENLVAITKSDHRRTHAGWIKTDGQWSHKPCRACLILHPLSNFRLAKKGGSKYQLECKPCDNKRRIVRAKKARQSHAN